ncbi:hypothetical protein GCM10028777_38310 [Angustibacter speluncae]
MREPARPDDAVEVRFRKYDGRPHWVMWALPLGEDEHGHWLGSPAGQVVSRPDLSVDLPFPWALLVPRDQGFVAAFNVTGDPERAEVYVDMTTVPVWETPQLVTAADLDLDVVRMVGGRVFVDDEDEFAEHRVAFGYPPQVVELAQESCRWVHDRVAADAEPFGDVARAWMDAATRL